MKRYIELRKRARAAGIDQKEWGKAIGRSQVYVSNCLTGRTAFRIDEAYKTMQLIGADLDEFSTLFPPGGLDKNAPKKREEPPIYKLVQISR